MTPTADPRPLSLFQYDLPNMMHLLSRRAMTVAPRSAFVRVDAAVARFPHAGPFPAAADGREEAFFTAGVLFFRSRVETGAALHPYFRWRQWT
jgi:hypothetical protein